jgi:hypothetical protein
MDAKGQNFGLEDALKAQNMIAKRYLMLSCTSVECQDCKWRIRFEALNPNTGEEIHLEVWG